MAEAPGQAAPAAASPEAAIEALLDAGIGSLKPPLPAVKAAPEVKAPEVKAESAQPETDAEVKPAANQQVEGEDAPVPDGEAEIPLDQLEAIELEVTTKGEDGKDVAEKLPIKELKLGYMRTKDYQRKTAEVARQREEVGEKLRQGIESERTQYQQNLQLLHNVVVESVAPELKGVNWNDLAANNPGEYVRLRNRADQVTQVLTSIQAKQAEATTKQKADQGQALQKAAQEARKTLEADITGWNDTLYQTLMKAGERFGYKPDEVAQWVDPRAIKLLHAAYQFSELKVEKPPADKKVVAIPKVIKPGVVTETSQARQRESEAMKKLQASGRIDDAAAVIRGRL